MDAGYEVRDFFSLFFMDAVSLEISMDALCRRDHRLYWLWVGWLGGIGLGPCFTPTTYLRVSLIKCTGSREL